MKIFLYLFYYFSKYLVDATFRIFYSKTTVFKKEQFDPKGPCIIVANHPSTMMDPLNVVARIRPQVHFLANGGLFLTRFNRWFFNTFYCIPIYRKIDTKGGKTENADSFLAANAHLEKGGLLYIAPEGTSYPPRQMKKLKTGFARIAFAAEAANNFELGLTIFPVGLSYTDTKAFKAEIILNPGELIKVSDFKDEYEADSRAAVRSLTAHLAERMEAIIINNHSNEEEQLTKQIEEMRRNEGRKAVAEEYKTDRATIQNWREHEQSQAYVSFKYAISRYFLSLKKEGLSDKAIQEERVRFGEIVGLILGFPIFLFGYINNFLPIWTAGFLERRFNPHESYEATAKYLGGFLSFPFFYTIQTIIVSQFFEAGWVHWLYLLILIPTGQFAWSYLQGAQLIRQKMKLQKLIRNKKRVSALLIRRRKLLLQHQIFQL